ncbi:hypothetical protein ACHAXT_003437, partial [Thalassiosira profunda]
MAPHRLLAATLLLALAAQHGLVAASSHCGVDYAEALLCSSPCASHGDCAADEAGRQRWCYGPGLDCPEVATGATAAATTTATSTGATTAAATSTGVTASAASSTVGSAATTTGATATVASSATSSSTTASGAGNATEDETAYLTLGADAFLHDNTTEPTSSPSVDALGDSLSEPTSAPTSAPTTAAPTLNGTLAPTEAPSPVPSAAPTTESMKLAEERRGMDNPSVHYCG